MLRVVLIVALVGSTAAVSACSSRIRVRPVAPPAQTMVSAVVLELAPEVRGKKEKLLVKYHVMEAMGLALRNSTAPGGSAQLIVTITQFRTGRWGPTVLHAIADVVGPDNQSQARYEAHSVSMAGSRKSRIQKVAQQIVVKLINQMPR